MVEYSKKYGVATTYADAGREITMHGGIVLIRQPSNCNPRVSEFTLSHNCIVSLVDFSPYVFTYLRIYQLMFTDRTKMTSLNIKTMPIIMEEMKLTNEKQTAEVRIPSNMSR